MERSTRWTGRVVSRPRQLEAGTHEPLNERRPRQRLGVPAESHPAAGAQRLDPGRQRVSEEVRGTPLQLAADRPGSVLHAIREVAHEEVDRAGTDVVAGAGGVVGDHLDLVVGRAVLSPSVGDHEPASGCGPPLAEPGALDRVLEPLVLQPREQEGLVGVDVPVVVLDPDRVRSEEHTSELQSLMRISYAVFCLKKKTKITQQHNTYNDQIT